jgi:rSAM/selenodomain-associated transferase 1
MSRAAIVVLTKDPVPGRVKTRLIPALGAEGAARLHRAMVFETVSRARATGLPVRVALRGDLAGAFATALRARGCVLEAQADGDLGDRLVHALRGPGRRIALGTDCPTLRPEWLLDAARAPTPAAFGPSEDGGYWTVSIDGTGGPEETERLFRGVPWSSPDTLARSLDRARACGIGVSVLPTCYDIDEPPMLARLAADPRCPPALRPLLSPPP